MHYPAASRSETHATLRMFNLILKQIYVISNFFIVEPILPPRVIQQKRNVEMGETNTFSSRRTSCGIFCDGEYTFVLQHFIGTDGCKSSKQF